MAEAARAIAAVAVGGVVAGAAYRLALAVAANTGVRRAIRIDGARTSRFAVAAVRLLAIAADGSAIGIIRAPAVRRARAAKVGDANAAAAVAVHLAWTAIFAALTETMRAVLVAASFIDRATTALSVVMAEAIDTIVAATVGSIVAAASHRSITAEAVNTSAVSTAGAVIAIFCSMTEISDAVSAAAVRVYKAARTDAAVLANTADAGLRGTVILLGAAARCCGVSATIVDAPKPPAIGLFGLFGAAFRARRRNAFTCAAVGRHT